VVEANSTTATLTIDTRSPFAANTPPASSGMDHSALTVFGMMMPAIFLIVPIGSRSKKAARSRRIGTALGLLLLVVMLINGCGGKPPGPLADRVQIGTPVDLGKNSFFVNGPGIVSMTNGDELLPKARESRMLTEQIQ